MQNKSLLSKSEKHLDHGIPSDPVLSDLFESVKIICQTTTSLFLNKSPESVARKSISF